MKRLVTLPHIAVVFTPFGSDTADIDEWCDATMPGRWYALIGGDHEFHFNDVLEDGSDQDSTFADYFVFDSASDLALFKLRWGGEQ